MEVGIRASPKESRWKANLDEALFHAVQAWSICWARNGRANPNAGFYWECVAIQEACIVITVELPWPHKDLSPNSRKHWGNRYRKAKVHKSTAMALTLHAAGWRLPAAGMNPTGPFVLTLKFIPPANRHYDIDNLIARMKSPLDGVAQALSTDDRRFRFGEITLEPAQKPGKVIVTIQEAA